jgi:hypothetical protein
LLPILLLLTVLTYVAPSLCLCSPFMK